MLKNIKRAIHEHNMICNGDNVIVALSGGADSVSLLLALDELKSELGITISACHINHKLRGCDSDSDENFTRTLCDERNIPLKVFSLDINSAKKNHESIEETAREARYSVFSGLCENAKIATAHTATDNAETVLLNLTRGTGLRGLCGIPPVRDYIIRPLIYCERSDVLQFLREKGQNYAVDKSNFDDCYSRNKIRLGVIPVLTQINSGLAGRIQSMCTVLRADDDFLYELAQNGLKKAEAGNNQYNSAVLRELPRPVLHRALSVILKRAAVEPSSLRINGIADMLTQNSGKINLCKNKFAVLKNGLLSVDMIEQRYRKRD